MLALFTPIRLAAVAGMVLGTAALGINATLVFASIYVVYRIFANRLSLTIFSSRCSQLVLAVVAYLTVLQAVVMCSWLISYNFPLDWCTSLTGILLLIAGALKFFVERNNRPNGARPRPRLISSMDVLALSVGVVVMGMILIGPSIKSFTRSGAIRASSISMDLIETLDDSNHLGRINDRLQLNRGVLYKSDSVQYVFHPDSISIYPQAWTAANALVIKSLDHNITVGGKSVVAYAASKLFWTFIMVYGFCWTALICLRMKPAGAKFSKKTYVFGTLILVFLSYYTLLGEFKEGFYTFIPLLISLFFAVPLFLQLFDEKTAPRQDTKIAESTYNSSVPLILLMVNVILSWFLILPAVAGALLVCFGLPTKHARFSKNIANLLREQLVFAPIVVVVLVAVVVQLIVIMSPGSQSFSTGINTPGGFTMLSPAYFAFVGLGATMFFSLSGGLTSRFRYVLILLACLLGFSFFVYLFQMLTVDKPGYYFYKTLSSFILPLSIIAVAGWTRMYAQLTERTDFLTSTAVMVIAVASLLLVVGINPLNDNLVGFVRGERVFTKSETAYMYQSLSETARISLKDRTSETIFYTPGLTDINLIASNIVESEQPIDSCTIQIFKHLNVSNPTDLMSHIKACERHQLVLVTKPGAFDQIQQAVEQANLDGIVQVVAIE